MNATSFMLGLVFSAIGLAFFVYGRKQRVFMPLLCGVALMAYPYFVTNNTALVAIGIVLVAVAAFVRL